MNTDKTHKRTTDEQFYMIKKSLIELMLDTEDIPKLNTMALQLYAILERLDKKIAKKLEE